MTLRMQRAQIEGQMNAAMQGAPPQEEGGQEVEQNVQQQQPQETETPIQ